MDVTKAELVSRTNWRRQDKTESVGEWKARVYEVHNVVFSFRSRKVTSSENDVAGSEQVLPLELDEDEDGFLVAENPQFMFSNSERRRHSSFVREEREWVHVGRKSVDVVPFSAAPEAPPHRRAAIAVAPTPQTKEKAYVKSLRPSVWLTEQFPLKTEELLPLLDILANKVKAVRRMRELLTTKFPPGTFPVKVAIPVVPTVHRAPADRAVPVPHATLESHASPQRRFEKQVRGGPKIAWTLLVLGVVVVALAAQ